MKKRDFYILLAIMTGYIFCIVTFILFQKYHWQGIFSLCLAICCEKYATKLKKDGERISRQKRRARCKKIFIFSNNFI